MWSQDEIIAFLKSNLNEHRFNHVLGVKEAAVKLAEHYGEDQEKAAYAALLHDCAKNKKTDELMDLITAEGWQMDDVEKAAPQLLHSKGGAIVAKNQMGVSDEDILNAIIFHTTGRANMTLLEKIIYLADYIEPSRNYPGVDEVRKEAYIDLDKTLVMSINNSVRYIIEKGQLIHIETINARNWLIRNKK